MSPFKKPSYTQMPNELFGLLPGMGYAELKVTLVVLRETLGFHRARVQLSQKELCDLTGLSAPSVVSGADAAVQRGTILKGYDEESGATLYEAYLEDEAVKLLSEGIKQVNTPPKKLNKGYKATLHRTSNKEKIKEKIKESFAPDETGAGAAPDQPQPKPLNPRQQAIKELEEAFRDLSTLPLPARNNEKQKRGAAQRWWNPLAEIWEMCDKDTPQACLLMTVAYNAMIQSNLTVSAPASVLEKAKAIKALQTRGMGDQNGNPIISNPGLLALQQVEARARP